MKRIWYLFLVVMSMSGASLLAQERDVETSPAESASEVEATREKMKEARASEQDAMGEELFMPPHDNKHTILAEGGIGFFTYSDDRTTAAVGIAGRAALGYDYKVHDFIRVGGGYMFKAGLTLAAESQTQGSTTTVNTSTGGYFGGHGFYIGGSFTTLGSYMFEAKLTADFIFGEAGSYVTTTTSSGDVRVNSTTSTFLLSPRLAIGYRGAPTLFPGLGFTGGIAVSLLDIGGIKFFPDLYAGILVSF